MGLFSSVASIFGASKQKKANKKAEAALTEAYNSAATAIAAGNEQANQRFEQQRAETQPGFTYLRGVIANPGGLTEYQQQQLDDARRKTAIGLNASGLRGAGRATAAAIKSVEGDLAGRFLAENQNRADRAAGAIAGTYLDSTDKQAVLDRDTATARSSADLGIGNARAGRYIDNSKLTAQQYGTAGELADGNDFLKSFTKKLGF